MEKCYYAFTFILYIQSIFISQGDFRLIIQCIVVLIRHIKSKVVYALEIFSATNIFKSDSFYTFFEPIFGINI